jgi:hypothetical protein
LECGLKSKLSFILFLIFSLCFTGCSVSSSNKKRSRGSLKEAAEKASDKHEGDRTVQTTYEKSAADDDGSSFIFNLLKALFSEEESPKSTEQNKPTKSNNINYTDQNIKKHSVENALERINKIEQKNKIDEKFNSFNNVDSTRHYSLLRKKESSFPTFNNYSTPNLPPFRLESNKPFKVEESDYKDIEIKIAKTDIADTNQVVVNKDEDIFDYVPKTREYLFWRINFVSGILHSSDFYGNYQLGLGLTGFMSENWTFGIDFDHGYSNVQETSELSHSLKNGISLTDLSFSFNKHLSGSHTFMSPYYGFGAGFSLMTWRYKNALIAIEENGETDTIHSDGLFGLDLFISGGTKTFQRFPFNLSLETNAGIKLWFAQTYQDFENDLFDPTPYLNFIIRMEFQSKWWN